MAPWQRRAHGRGSGSGHGTCSSSSSGGSRAKRLIFDARIHVYLSRLIGVDEVGVPDQLPEKVCVYGRIRWRACSVGRVPTTSSARGYLCLLLLLLEEMGYL